jgi:hypothetical protein
MGFNCLDLAGDGGVVLPFLIDRDPCVAICPELACHLTILKKRMDLVPKDGPEQLDLTRENRDMVSQVGDNVQRKLAGAAPATFGSFEGQGDRHAKTHDATHSVEIVS